MFGVAVQYDAAIDPTSLALDTYTASVFPATRDGGDMMGGPGGGGPGSRGAGGAGGPGMMGPMGEPQSSASPAPMTRPIVAIYTNSEPGLLRDRKSVAGMYVIAEFVHDPDLSSPTTDGDKVSITQVGR